MNQILFFMTALLFSSPLIAQTATQATHSYRYYDDGKMKSIDGPRTDVADITTLTYHPDSHLVHTLKDAMQYTTTFAQYNAQGQPEIIIDANNITYTLGYYPEGWLASVEVKPLSKPPRTTYYGYTAVGDLAFVVLPNGAELNYEYNTANQLTAIQNGVGERIEYTPDSEGNIRFTNIKAQKEGEIFFTVERVYDELSRVINVLGNNGQNDIFEYNADNNLKKIYDAKNNITELNYDNINRLADSTSPLGAKTVYGYDSNDQLETVTDGRNLTTAYTVNGLGDVTLLTSPDTGQTQYEYDAAGNLKWQQDARGVVATYTYNAANQLTHIIYPAHPEENVTFSYFERGASWGANAGALNTIIKNGSYQDFFYTKYGEIWLRGNTVDGVFTDEEFVYYDNGNLEKVIRYSLGHVRTLYYTWDEHGRLNNIDIAVSGKLARTPVVSQIDYMPFGPARFYQYGNGLNHTVEYDTDYNVDIITVDGIDPVLEYIYDFNELNQITQIRDASLGGNIRDYDYRDDGRLNYSNDRSYYSQLYHYDEAGNRIRRSSSSPAGVVVDNYIYADDSNRLTQVNKFNVTQRSMTSETYGYTENGNRSTKLANYITHRYTYNAANRLITYTQGSNATHYSYNPLGQRILKTHNGQKTRYLYNSAGQLASVLNDTSLVRDYIYMGEQAVAMVVYTDGEPAIYYIHNDHLATAQKLTNANQQVVWAGDYDAFGAVTRITNDQEVFTRFPGQVWDKESGLYYNYFRDYDPELGRYIQSDPIGLAGGVNTFGYVGGRPVTYVDPKGLEFRTLTGVERFRVNSAISLLESASYVTAASRLGGGQTIISVDTSLSNKPGSPHGQTRGLAFHPWITLDDQAVNGQVSDAALGGLLAHEDMHGVKDKTWIGRFDLIRRLYKGENPEIIPTAYQEEVTKDLEAFQNGYCRGR